MIDLITCFLTLFLVAECWLWQMLGIVEQFYVIEAKKLKCQEITNPFAIERERKRIEAFGGYVYDGYLNGQVNVACALGDWHMEGMKGADGGPLSAEPELMIADLTEEDEFLIIGCDELWDVFRSQNAIDFARRRLQEHNDPVMCSEDQVDEALKRKNGDNLIVVVVVVCFQSCPPLNLVAPCSKLQSFLDNLGN